MPNPLTNLLPPERQREIARDYIVRVSTVAVMLVTILVVVAGALLLPLYVYLAQAASVKAERLRSVETTLGSSEDVSLSERLTALTSDASTLGMLASSTSVAATIRNVLGIAHAGASLTSLNYTPAMGAGTVVLSGTAATRDALSTYKLALERSALSKSVVLPVSSFAQDTKISFTITLILAP
ncbi:MAG: hypothetical protein JWN18_725 [Parcubacteria group bacterium]|nr:hypothetical protein [Parcubacteria group bacterium]